MLKLVCLLFLFPYLLTTVSCDDNVGNEKCDTDDCSSQLVNASPPPRNCGKDLYSYLECSFTVQEGKTISSAECVLLVLGIYLILCEAVILVDQHMAEFYPIVDQEN